MPWKTVARYREEKAQISNKRERARERESVQTMKEGADVYRVRDNQRGATLIIVIGVLSLKRRVTRMRCAACAPRRAHRLRELRTQGDSKGPIAAAPPARCMRARSRVRCVHPRHGIVPRVHVRCGVRYAPLLYESICTRTARHGRTRITIIGHERRALIAFRQIATLFYVFLGENYCNSQLTER